MLMLDAPFQCHRVSCGDRKRKDSANTATAYDDGRRSCPETGSDPVPRCNIAKLAGSPAAAAVLAVNRYRAPFARHRTSGTVVGCCTSGCRKASALVPAASEPEPEDGAESMGRRNPTNSLRGDGGYHMPGCRHINGTGLNNNNSLHHGHHHQAGVNGGSIEERQQANSKLHQNNLKNTTTNGHNSNHQHHHQQQPQQHQTQHHNHPQHLHHQHQHVPVVDHRHHQPQQHHHQQQQPHHHPNGVAGGVLMRTGNDPSIHGGAGTAVGASGGGTTKHSESNSNHQHSNATGGLALERGKETRKSLNSSG
uniref:Uncharacterized protein n=1 Tax=Anopheles albimanus TaxID=7167 RepID=A0A182F930_ANOAL